MGVIPSGCVCCTSANVMHMSNEARRRRITVNLPDHEHGILQRLSAANGESMSSIVASLVEAVAPALERVAEVAEVANGAMPDVLDGLNRAADEGERLLNPLFSAGITAFDQATARMVDASRVSQGDDPRPSNTGVGL